MSEVIGSYSRGQVGLSHDRETNKNLHKLVTPSINLTRHKRTVVSRPKNTKVDYHRHSTTYVREGRIPNNKVIEKYDEHHEGQVMGGSLWSALPFGLHKLAT
tara:strand:+ start:15462 stop:15767 length:306 start_codon:yes stop_codon:yes gene_type:complete